VAPAIIKGVTEIDSSNIAEQIIKKEEEDNE